MNISIENTKAISTIIAALRYLKANRDDAIEAFDGSFTDTDLMTEEEIDEFCDLYSVGSKK